MIPTQFSYNIMPMMYENAYITILCTRCEFTHESMGVLSDNIDLVCRTTILHGWLETERAVCYIKLG
jgi:hypothetical protein